MISLKKYINHILHDVDPAKAELTLDMWGSNGWRAYAIHDLGDRWRIFLRREIQNPIDYEPRDNMPGHTG